MLKRCSKSVFLLTIISLCATTNAHLQTEKKQSSVHKNPAEFKGTYWDKNGFKLESGWKPVTKDETASAFGKAFEKSIASKDVKASTALIYMKPLYERAVDGVTIKEFKQGFGGAWSNATTQLIANMSVEGSSIKFVGVRKSPAGPGAMMRLLLADGSCVYQLWYLVNDDDGKTRALDAFIYFSGENLSETVRRLALLSVPKDDRTFVEKLTGKELEFSKNTETLVKLLQANGAREFKAVLEIFDELPASLKKEKFTMMLRLSAAMQSSDDDLYVKVLKEYQSQFPNDPSLDLISLDLNFLTKKFDKVHESMERLQKTIGEDSHLRTLRATAYYEEGKAKEGIENALKAIEIQSDLVTPHFLLVALYAKKGDFDEATTILRKLVSQFGFIEFDHSDPVFARLVKSMQYADFELFRKATIKNLEQEKE